MGHLHGHRRAQGVERLTAVDEQLLAALEGVPDVWRSDRAREWCMEGGLDALDACDDADAAARALQILSALDGGGGLDLVRPVAAISIAACLRRATWPQDGAAPSTAALAPLCRYARAVPPREACRFAVDWAADLCAEGASAPPGPAAAAVALAALTLSRVLSTAGRPPIDMQVYNDAVQATRDLFLRLAQAEPPGGLRFADVIEGAAAQAADLGFSEPETARLETLVLICRDFGRSLSTSTHPAARFLA